MADVVLITGGSRSGKSSCALERAEALAAKRTFVATCPPVDEEMAARIQRHREQRRGRAWETTEEPLELDRVLATVSSPVVVVDCLTLWISNLMLEAARTGEDLDEDGMATHCARLLEVCAQLEGTVFFVTNEVGLGIVPDNPISRRYRDLVGRCNQTMAAGADEVIFTVSGIPVRIK